VASAIGAAADFVCVEFWREWIESREMSGSGRMRTGQSSMDRGDEGIRKHPSGLKRLREN
jgi:hypothetical protein